MNLCAKKMLNESSNLHDCFASVEENCDICQREIIFSLQAEVFKPLFPSVDDNGYH